MLPTIIIPAFNPNAALLALVSPPRITCRLSACRVNQTAFFFPYLHVLSTVT